MNKDLVREYWSKFDCSASDKNFYAFPPIRGRSCQLTFGEYDPIREDWVEYRVIEKYLKGKIPFNKCLSICCGFGGVERTLARHNLAKEIVGTDIAQGAIDEARKKALSEGFDNITYYACDINQEQLPVDEYDIVWANGALHHIKDLDIVIPMLKKSLKKDGFLISTEYVGPSYQQINKRNMELVNAVKHLLPSELKTIPTFKDDSKSGILNKLCNIFHDKREKANDNDIYNKIWDMPSKDYYLRTDPSEYVNSINIIPTIKANFANVEIKYFNGFILQHALDSAFYNNFDVNNKNHFKLLQMLFDLEDVLIEQEGIMNPNAIMICRK